MAINARTPKTIAANRNWKRDLKVDLATHARGSNAAFTPLQVVHQSSLGNGFAISGVNAALR
jgi:hypothetical protein